MKQIVLTTCILGVAMITGSCATKKYVRNTTTPIQAKVDQVGEQANKQGQDIETTRGDLKKVDENAQAGISAAKERAMTADSRANEAMTKANQVGEVAQKNTEEITKTNQDLGSLKQTFKDTMSSLDDYKMQTEAVVPFRFNMYSLDDHAREELDKLAQSATSLKRYYIAVEGFTDPTGPKEYNMALSRRRADAVVQYLVTKHDIPLYRIQMLGLGEQKPAETGHNRAARAKNRRVEVRIFNADQKSTLSQLK